MNSGPRQPYPRGNSDTRLGSSPCYWITVLAANTTCALSRPVYRQRSLTDVTSAYKSACNVKRTLHETPREMNINIFNARCVRASVTHCPQASSAPVIAIPRSHDQRNAKQRNPQTKIRNPRHSQCRQKIKSKPRRQCARLRAPGSKLVSHPHVHAICAPCKRRPRVCCKRR